MIFRNKFYISLENFYVVEEYSRILRALRSKIRPDDSNPLFNPKQLVRRNWRQVTGDRSQLLSPLSLSLSLSLSTRRLNYVSRVTVRENSAQVRYLFRAIVLRSCACEILTCRLTTVNQSCPGRHCAWRRRDYVAISIIAVLARIAR